MNNPRKAVSVDVSALLSLKAELGRKQMEMMKARKVTNVEIADSGTADNQDNNCNEENTEDYSSNQIHKPKAKKRLKNTATKDSTNEESEGGHQSSENKKKQKKQKSKTETSVHYLEDSALLSKSKRILKQKAKLYEEWSKSGGYLNCDDECLVMFNKKSQEEGRQTDGNPQSNGVERKRTYLSFHENDDSSDSSGDENDLVEYTDCFGRTRKCLRKELKDIAKRDKELAAEMPERLKQAKVNSNPDGDETEENNEVNEDITLLSKHEQQRINWERKVEENLNKSNIHYQDVFFDEARQHGVGYYAFSTNEDERFRQQQELLKMHEETLKAQQSHEMAEMRKQNFKNLRILAAKNRLRASQGLPPLKLEDLEEVKEQECSQTTTEEQEQAEKLRKMEQAEIWRKELQEELRQEMERQQHVRPWDVNKPKQPEADEDTDTWQYKVERELMTQEQWLELKRKERPEEFAPPSNYK